MLTPNEIPRKEPKVRIGIILPTDSIKTLRCSFSDPQCYEIETSTKILPSCKNEKEFNIQIPDDQAENIATVGQAISYIENI